MVDAFVIAVFARERKEELRGILDAWLHDPAYITDDLAIKLTTAHKASATALHTARTTVWIGPLLAQEEIQISKSTVDVILIVCAHVNIDSVCSEKTPLF